MKQLKRFDPVVHIREGSNPWNDYPIASCEAATLGKWTPFADADAALREVELELDAALVVVRDQAKLISEIMGCIDIQLIEQNEPTEEAGP